MENYTTTPYSPSKPKSKNKLKLFGAEIGFSQNHEPENEYYAEEDQMSLDSSSTASGSPDEKKKKKKKYECKWCFKVLANSQALGGHQNAHKKERMMKKIQLQASQAAGLGYYVDQDYCYSYDDHRQISFGNGDDQFFSGSDFTFQGEENVHGFSLTHTDNMSSTSNYHHLDLQLGLGL